VCENSFAKLEDSLTLVLRRLKVLQSESAHLRRDNLKLKESLEELERENRDRREEADRLREDLSRIRERVERVVNNVAVLEESSADSSIRANGESKA